MLLRFLLFPLVSAFVFIGSGQSQNQTDLIDDLTDRGGIPVNSSMSSVSSEREIEERYFGVAGNQYFPVSALEGVGRGNVQVSIKNVFNQSFESCSMPLADGSLAPLTCVDSAGEKSAGEKCVDSSGNQVWQASFRCTSVLELKVICIADGARVLFTVPEGAGDQVCSQFS